MKLIWLFFLKKLFILLFDVQEEDIKESEEENNNCIYDNNDNTKEDPDNHDLSVDESKQEDFTYFDGNREINLIKKNYLI